MTEDLTTLSTILLVCTIIIAVSNALTAYAIYWERKQKNLPPYVGFRMIGNAAKVPGFVVENPSERLYQIVKISFRGNLNIAIVSTEEHKCTIFPSNHPKHLYIEKLKPGDFISGHLSINNPNNANPFLVEIRVFTFPGEKIVLRRKGLFHYFKKVGTDDIFYVYNPSSKLTFISKFKHARNLCHCREHLEERYAGKFQPIDSFHSLKDASLRTK